MKRLLILMLVTCVASTADATLTLVSSAGDTLDPTGATFPNITWIGLYNDTWGEYAIGNVKYFVIAAADPGQWTGNATFYVPPSHGGTNIYYGLVDPGTGIGTVDLWQCEPAMSVERYDPGVLSAYEFVCTGIDDVTITVLRDDIATVIDTITIHQIPEPITFGLLGLGGLFLRRRT